MDKDLQLRLDSLTQELEKARSSLARSRALEASLRASEDRYRTLFESASVGLAQMDPEGRFIEVNGPLCRLLGYAREDLLRRTHFDLLHVEDRAREHEQWTHLLSGNVARLAGERRYLRADGAPVWIYLNLTVSNPGLPGNLHVLAAMENISERKAIQESLRRIAATLANADALALAGSWKWDVDSGEVTASPEVLELYGLPPSMTPVPVEEFLHRTHPEDAQRLRSSLERAVAEQRPYVIEFRLRMPDGSERLLSSSGEMFSRNAAGRARVMIGMVQDITRRRQAEKAIRDNERQFRELFDSAVDGILIADRNCNYIDANPSACALLGYRKDELLGRPVGDLVSPWEQQRLQRLRDYLLENVQHVEVGEWELLRKDGSGVPVEVSTRILPDGRWMVVLRDVRERHRTQRELERYATEVLDLYDNAPCGYHSLDADGVFVRINRTELEWLGYSREELVGKMKAPDLLTGESRQRFHDSYQEFMARGTMRDFELEFVRKNGSILPVLMNSSAIYDEHGRFLRSRTTLFDMTAMVEAQKKLRRAATVFEHTNDAIIITDADGVIVAVNKSFSQITGYRPEDVIGQNPRLLQSGRQDDAFYREMWQSLGRTGTWQGEIWDRRKSGELFPAWQTITAVHDDSGKVTDYISVFSDITTIKSTEEKLVRLAYHDALTGLPNRLLFNDRMAQALAHARRSRCRAALLLLDLDRFKLINDTLGHAAGDLLLQTVARRLKGAIREEDTIARLGGDEFAIVLPQLGEADDAALLAQKLIRLVCQPITMGNHVLTVSTSIGISVYPNDGTDPESLYKASDMALYGAKDKGRNGYEFYTREMTQAATETLLINRDLRGAIQRNELQLLFQPQIGLAERRIIGVEALVRWNCPARGLMAPARFIAVAEETDLIESIGDWVLDTAWKQLENWRDGGLPPVRLAINLSARQIKRASLVQQIRERLLSRPPGDGFGLDLEITEAALHTEADTVDALKELKTLGLRIAIDDFGTGYSSLNSLKHLPVDTLKIDRSFIHGIPGDQDDKAITSAIIAMGHSMGMRVIAEGVETAEQLQFVMHQRCDLVQGFLFHPPLPPDECARFLHAGTRVRLPAHTASRA